jgi:SAM-dependent methyltransferase
LKYRDGLELFVLSAVSLFLELLIIRWMSADIRLFTLLRTFPLLACFIGLGTGFALGKDKIYKYLPFSIASFSLIMRLMDFSGLAMLGFPALAPQASNPWPLSQGHGYALFITNTTVSVFLVTSIIFVLLFLPFVMCTCLGARLGTLFSLFRPLHAYSINIAGAIAGSILLTTLSLWNTAPWWLLLLPAVVVVCDLIVKYRRCTSVYMLSLATIPACILLIPEQHGLLFQPRHFQPSHKDSLVRTKELWSPYQRIDLCLFYDIKNNQPAKPYFTGLELSANRFLHQYFWIPPQKESLAFGFNSAKDVLVIGSGTGRTIEPALRAGATNIDAVDIDPLILAIGKKYNPSYSSAAVHLICDDARHFMSHAHNRYDVIHFACLDSFTLTGLGSSVRLDTYIYTKESIRKALSLLKPGGVLCIAMCSWVEGWEKEVLFKTFSDAAGYPPLVLPISWRGIKSDYYILGPLVKEGKLKPPLSYKQPPTNALQGVHELTDDWPYLYVKPDSINWPYLLFLTEIILLSMVACRKILFVPAPPLYWQMFFLGSAFMLLELHAISFLSLLFGSTWITSAIVINSILVVILIANALVERWRSALSKNQPAIYVVLLASIIMNYIFPADALIAAAADYQFVGDGIMVLLTLLPIGIAALIFANAFSSAPSPSRAMAFNLCGAVAGALLESLSIYWGIRSLNIIAMVLYSLSAWCFYAQHAGLKHKGRFGI